MKLKRGYYLLYRREDTHKVWVYEYLQKHEIQSRLKRGGELMASDRLSNYERLTKEKLIKLQSQDNLHNKGINIVWRNRYGMNFPYRLNRSGSVENCILGALVGDRECDLLILQQANRLRDERMMRL